VPPAASDEQRADADQLAPVVEQPGAAVVGPRRRGEQRVVDVVLPVAGEGIGATPAVRR
jgi:hypothetical protein